MLAKPPTAPWGPGRTARSSVLEQMNLTIDVVIPVHGGWKHTERCLVALAGQTVAHRVFVVDNDSPDDTVDRVRAGFPSVTVIEMGENAGYGRAVNAGAAAGDGDVVVALNNDVACAPDFLERAVEPFTDPTVGATVPLLLRPGGALIDAFGLSVDATLACFVRLQGSPLESLGAGVPIPALLGPHGGAAPYRRSALEAIGGFDERIFFYGEDLDVALRLRAAGWRSVEAPAARAVHENGATAGKRSAWQREHGGFGRGYVLRRYGVLRSRAGLRAAATELAVVVGDLLISRDLAAARGRVAGWRAGGHAGQRVPPPVGGSAIGFRESLRLRLADYGLLRH